MDFVHFRYKKLILIEGEKRDEQKIIDRLVNTALIGGVLTATASLAEVIAIYDFDDHHHRVGMGNNS
ncbi:hypothetical protein [Enterococcus sp. DIV0800]|uniref:hypothetical protein n=1 Tax=unclassified Enterococcus TaxID=2608891 RepID=UPI003D2FA76F